MARRKSVSAQVEGLTARMSNQTGKARRAGNRRLQAGAERIQETARMYAPVDEGDLENAIKLKTERAAGSRYNEYAVYVDEDMPGSNGAERVSDYSWIMHETLYNLGPVSSFKDRSVGGNGEGYGKGGVVGSFYLERAFHHDAPQIARSVRDAINRELK